jgi:hypothetical protein
VGAGCAGGCRRSLFVAIHNTWCMSSLPCKRNTRLRPFLMQNILILVHFELKSSLEPLVPQGASWVLLGCLLGASWVPPGWLLGVSCVHSWVLLCSTLLYSTLLYSTLFYSTPLRSTLLYSILLYSILLYSTLFYST